jgi:hypothetical protein
MNGVWRAGKFHSITTIYGSGILGVAFIQVLAIVFANAFSQS